MILESMGIKLLKDCISVVYDSRGDSYEVPNYCINMPSFYELRDEFKKKEAKDIEDEEITVIST